MRILLVSTRVGYRRTIREHRALFSNFSWEYFEFQNLWLGRLRVESNICLGWNLPRHGWTSGRGDRPPKHIVLLPGCCYFSQGYDVPLVADIHFQPQIAMDVAEAFEKIRINPGNFVDGRKTFDEYVYDSKVGH